MDTERVLVVDDDHLWLETIKDTLGAEYNLTLTSNAAEAIEAAHAGRFSLAILDQVLSDGSLGIDLFRQLRGVQPDLIAVILTGYAQVEDAVDSMKVGVRDYISKDTDNLAAVLRARVADALAAPDEQELGALLAGGEGQSLEFKSTARWDLRQNKLNHELEGVIVKTVSGFLNCDGGVLLIGVDDQGEVIGLSNDYQTLNRKDRDGFENFVTTLLLDAFGKQFSAQIRVSILHVRGADVCRIATIRAPSPVYVADRQGVEQLYIRTGNSTRQLSAREAVEYVRTRWRNPASHPKSFDERDY